MVISQNKTLRERERERDREREKDRMRERVCVCERERESLIKGSFGICAFIYEIGCGREYVCVRE